MEFLIKLAQVANRWSKSYVVFNVEVGVNTSILGKTHVSKQYFYYDSDHPELHKSFKASELSALIEFVVANKVYGEKIKEYLNDNNYVYSR